MFVFGQKGLYSGKVVVIIKTCLCSGKLVYSGISGCIWTKWFYSGKTCRNRAKVVVFVQMGCIRAKVVVYRQSGCICEKVVLFQQKWL